MLKRLSYPLSWMEGLTGEKEDESKSISDKVPSLPNSADSHHSSVFSKVFSRWTTCSTLHYQFLKDDPTFWLLFKCAILLRLLLYLFTLLFIYVMDTHFPQENAHLLRKRKKTFSSLIFILNLLFANDLENIDRTIEYKWDHLFESDTHFMLNNLFDR
jgi:hypothetical protein